MATVEWTIPFSLVSSQGTVLLNAAETIGSDQVYYLLDQAKCWARPEPLRGSTDPLPQEDGSILHPIFKSGYSMQLCVEFWETADQAACGGVLRMMWDHLMFHLNDLLRNDGRVMWTPTAHNDMPDDRMLVNTRLREDGWPQVEYDGVVTSATFTVQTRFPYAIDATEIDTDIAAGDTVTITNAGNCDVHPVVEVHGAAGVFFYKNVTTGLYMQYDSGFPGAIGIGGGDDGEFIHFRDTAYLNGNGANLKPGIDVTISEFFTLPPGDNEIQASGADISVKSWNAWA